MDFKIWIKSIFDRKGAADAQRDLRKVGDAAQDAARKADGNIFSRFFGSIRAGASRARRELANLTRAFRGFLALAGIGGLGMMTRSMLTLAEAVEKNAQIANTTNVEWQQLAFTARQNKADAEILARAFARLNENLGESPELIEKHGIATRTSTGETRRSIDVFRDVADAVAAAATGDQRATIAKDALGRASRDLIPLLRQGSAALDEFAQKAPIMDEDTIRRLNDAKDALDAFQTRATIAAGSLAGRFQKMVEAIGEGVAGLSFGGITAEEFEAMEARKQAIRELAEEGEHARAALEGNLPIPIWGGKARTQAAEAQAAVEQRTQDILNEQVKARLEYAKAEGQAAQAAADAAAKEAARLALQERLQAALTEEQAVHERLAQIREAFNDAEEAAAYEKLTSAEKLLALEEKRISLDWAAHHEGDLDAARELLAIEQERARILDQIDRKKERGRQALEDELAEYRILQARAAGNEALANQLEQEAQLKRDIKRLTEETGLSEQQAETFLRRKLDLENQIARAKDQTAQATKKQTTEEERLLEIARKDPEGRTVKGREARDELQRRGSLSRNATTAQRQLMGADPTAALNQDAQATDGLAQAILAKDAAIIAHIQTHARQIDELRRHQERTLARLEADVRNNR